MPDHIDPDMPRRFRWLSLSSREARHGVYFPRGDFSVADRDGEITDGIPPVGEVTWIDPAPAEEARP